MCAKAKKAEKPAGTGELTSAEEKQKALDAVCHQITKDYGQGAIMKLGANAHMSVSAISTGSLTLDMALGIGGVPKGRIVEIYGPESSGKTTLALHVVAEAQKKGGICAFIDAEHALDPVYAKALGVDIDNLLVSQPDSGEQALEITEALVRSGAVEVLVVDSVAALVPQSEIDGDMGSAQVGAHARLMSQAMRKLSGSINKSNAVVIFINQLREKVGVMYGNPEVTTGGRALKFYASVRIDIRKADALKEGGVQYGNRVKCKIVKNKVAPPFKTAEFDLIFGKGISQTGELFDLAVQYEIIEKSGSWFSYGGERLGQGRENAMKALDGMPELFEEIKDKVRATASAPEADLGDADGAEFEDDDGLELGPELSLDDLDV